MEFSFRHHRHRRHEDCSDRDLLLLIILELEEIEEKVDSLLPLPPPPDLVSGTISFQGDSMSDITLPAGTTSEKAVATFLDANGSSGTPAPAPVWAVDDSSLASVASDPADSTGQTADVSLFAGASGGSVKVTATATNADGTTAVATGTITVESSVPPAVDLVSGDIAFSS